MNNPKCPILGMFVLWTILKFGLVQLLFLLLGGRDAVVGVLTKKIK